MPCAEGRRLLTNCHLGPQDTARAGVGRVPAAEEGQVRGHASVVGVRQRLARHVPEAWERPITLDHGVMKGWGDRG